ncbi:MAG: hypothetical protein NC911_06660 [Candidatus Omnitrophica bacterium]|nr:hypothetical protein [Candidatus Omnitrophota bacterium]MCM8769336.1 hypothetical protein [Candidatus Omnitrophota bacterium]
MKIPVKVAVIGLGSFGLYISRLHNKKGLLLAAVCDKDTEKNQKGSKRLGLIVPRYAEAETTLTREKFDLAISAEQSIETGLPIDIPPPLNLGRIFLFP